MPIDIMIEIAEYTNTTIDYLLYGTDEFLIEDEKEIINLYRNLDSNNQNHIKGYLRGMIAAKTNKR